MLLALVSPTTYRLLVEWRRRTYGDERKMRRALETARINLLRYGRRRRDLGLRGSVRSKGLWSTFHKAAIRSHTVHDVLALRIIVDGDESSCYAALGEVRRLYPAVDRRYKDYVRSPKPNGYRALHDTVMLPCGTPMEVQIRTTQMHRHAEWGAASHRGYKGPLWELPRRLATDMASLAAAPPKARPKGAVAVSEWAQLSDAVADSFAP